MLILFLIAWVVGWLLFAGLIIPPFIAGVEWWAKKWGIE